MSNLGNKQIMADNIRYYMDKYGLNATEFANKLDFKYTTVLDWINAKTYPRIDKIEIMANYFNIEKSDLVEEYTPTPKKKGVKIPVLGEVAAGVPIEAIEDIIDYEEITEEMASRGNFFGLKIKGDSMEPNIMNGDTVIVRQQPDAESGDTVIVVVNGDSATCKKIKKQSNGLMLIPVNPNYETTFYSNEEINTIPITIIGKVVELRRQF